MDQPKQGRSDPTWVPWLLAVGFVLSLTLFVFQPIAHGRSYQLGVRVNALLALTWYLSAYRSELLESKKFLRLLFFGSFYFVIQRPLTIKPNSEIVAAYGSAFAALDRGANPYDCQCVVHFVTDGSSHQLGNFNYPPLELLPYYAIAKLLGRWDAVVLALSLVFIQLLACALLVATFRNEKPWRIAAFVPLIACFELYTNVALTLLTVAVLVWLLVGQARRYSRGRELALLAVFGFGLLTKFLIIPLFAVFLWQRSSFRSSPDLVKTLGRALVPLVVAALGMLPFGIWNVLHETVLFNLNLSERAKLTTFYPNALSGMLEWLGARQAFSVCAVLLLGCAILALKRQPLLRAMFLAAAAFLIVSPTPEPQYVPVVIYLALASVLLERRFQRASPALQSTLGAPQDAQQRLASA